MKMKRYFEFNTVSVTVSGDYFQVMIHNALDTEDEPYFMIQRQFEFRDDGSCYIESHKEELIEHSKVKSALLSPGKLLLSYGDKIRKDVEIKFNFIDKKNFQELESTLIKMIKKIQVAVQ